MSRRVKLGDVASRIKDKIDKDNTSLEYYIGGEHIDSGRIVINKKAPLKGSTIGPAFHMHFMPGDVLLMSRNPHLCKASMTDFEGICSDVSYVVRTKDESVFTQRLLPFVVQTKAFWRFAEENKRGGMPFFLNWKDFAEFEFNLPDPEEQEKIADLLWAAEKTKEAYEEQLALTDELVKSQFIEMFIGKEYPVYALSELCSKITDGTHKTPDYQENGVVFISAKNVSQGFLDLSDVKYITQKEYEDIQKRCQTERGDVILSKSGTLGVPAIIDTDVPLGIFESLAVLKYDRSRIDGTFLKEQLRSEQVQLKLLSGVKGVAVKHLHLNVISSTQIIVPPLDDQKRFAAFVEQSDKSKFELKQSIEKVEAIIKSLSEQTFA